jgi:phosphatidylglycerophosphate synthase
MAPARTLVNAISLSRIPIALLFVVFLKPLTGFLYISIVLYAAAFATDQLDGYFARKFGIASTTGRHWDSLGDKSFYAAVIVSFLTNELLNPLLGWALLVREIALYITRILYIENIAHIELSRPYTKGHGCFLHATIVLGLAEMYGRLHNSRFELYTFTQVAAAAALCFGLASIWAYIRLPKDKRAIGTAPGRPEQPLE